MKSTKVVEYVRAGLKAKLPGVVKGTDAEVARAFGMSQAQLSQIVKGRTKLSNIRYFYNAAKVLGTTTDTLVAVGNAADGGTGG
jgi:transcriptional regulator with XRE-family HTH domain